MAEANDLAYRNSRETKGKDTKINLEDSPKEKVTKFVHVQTDASDKEKL
jgi:hypothetical protein